jgi:hypothetical protein
VPKETSAWGTSTVTITGNNAKMEVPVAELSLSRVLEANASEIPERVEIPHQLEV